MPPTYDVERAALVYVRAAPVFSPREIGESGGQVQFGEGAGAVCNFGGAVKNLGL